LLGIEYPVLQAGMGRSRGLITTPQLVAAVSEAGGLGCIGGEGLDPEELRATIREVRKLTARPFGVDLLLPAKREPVDMPVAELREYIRNQYPDHVRFVQSLYDRYGLPHLPYPRQYTVTDTLIRQQVQVVIDERVPVFVAGLGDPGPFVPALRERGIKVLGIAGSPRHARRHKAAGVDAVIAQGYEAGGHTGNIATMVLVPQVVDEVRPLPVIAAGGIVDGRGLVAALALGATGVWCGTLFLFSKEANVHDLHRRQLLQAAMEDLVVSRCYTGKPSRVYRNEVVELWQRGPEPLGFPLQMLLMDDFVTSAEAQGRLELVNNPAGQAAGRLTAIRSAGDIVRSLVEEAEEVIGRLAGRSARRQVRGR
jgi:NAD(P)H-dependent flavin oxidoreductase YrpB (nitropropane dioxygenase family)